MNQPQMVVLEYLRSLSANQDPEHISQESEARQTQAVNNLLKRLLNSSLSDYRDKVFAVGGAVRDELLGKVPDDLDLVVDDPKEGMKSAENFSKDFVKALGSDIASDNKSRGFYRPKRN